MGRKSSNSNVDSLAIGVEHLKSKLLLVASELCVELALALVNDIVDIEGVLSLGILDLIFLDSCKSAKNIYKFQG